LRRGGDRPRVHPPVRRTRPEHDPGPRLRVRIEMGSLVSEDQVKTVSGRRRRSCARWATVVAGGKIPAGPRAAVLRRPVLTGVTPEMECYANETFGPLVVDLPGRRVEEAIARANHRLRAQRERMGGQPRRGRGPSGPRHGGHRQRRRGLRPHLGSSRRPRWAAWGCRRRAAATAPKVCSSTRRRRPSRPPPGWSSSAVRGGLPAKVWAMLLPPFIKAIEVRAGTLTRPPTPSPPRVDSADRSLATRNTFSRGDSTH
ncbi:aldehyde dehydrogenase family protein, partial [Rhodococcus hoagii]|nr:aldehyde dehydrogenase family protein [Prescottella equi]